MDVLNSIVYSPAFSDADQIRLELIETELILAPNNVSDPVVLTNEKL